MVQLYSGKVYELSKGTSEYAIEGSLSYLKQKEVDLLKLVLKYNREFTPIELSKLLGVTNRTIINRLSILVKNGFVEPVLVNERIRSYKLSEFTKTNLTEIKNSLSE